MILVLKLLNSRTWMTLQFSKVIFQALETSAASLTSVSSATLLALTAYTAFFPQKTSWSWLFDHPCHQNDQHRSLGVDWILKNPIFYRYLVPFLSEAVEANLCYFFENWLIKLKCPNLRNTLVIYQPHEAAGELLNRNSRIAPPEVASLCFNLGSDRKLRKRQNSTSKQM